MKGENAEKNGSKAGKQWWGKRPLKNMPVSRNKGMVRQTLIIIK